VSRKKALTFDKYAIYTFKQHNKDSLSADADKQTTQKNIGKKVGTTCRMRFPC